MILFVVGANLFAGLVYPLQPVPHNLIPPLQLSESAITFKFKRLCQGPSPDLMLLGSSLPMCAFYYAEGTLNPAMVELTEQNGLNLIQSYHEANYLRAQIMERTGKQPFVFNFTTAACMPSDARLLLLRIINSKRRPSMLLYGVGLRDFVDNVNPPPGETPAFKSLCDAGYLAGNSAVVKKSEARTELAISSLFQFYRLRDQYRLLAEHLACREFNRQTNLERAFSTLAAERNQKSKQVPAPHKPTKDVTPAPSLVDGPRRTNVNEPKQQTNTLRTSNEKIVGGSAALPSHLPGHTEAGTSNQQKQPTAVCNNARTSSIASATKSNLAALDYKERYNPPNYNQLASELSELRDIVELCKQSDIRIVLVNMPVSDHNKGLSAPRLREKYLASLRQLSAQMSVPLIDFEDKNIFEERDFLDTVHLSGYGARKMIAQLLDAMSAQGILSMLK